MSTAYDLFISYKSDDRPWAAKLYQDLGEAYPWLKIFWDRVQILPGGGFRAVLDNAIITPKHLLVLWSNRAAISGEVQAEISDFKAEVRRVPELECSSRLTIPVILEGNLAGGLQDIQGFPDFKAYYDPNAADLGMGKLATEPGLSQWRRMVRMLGDTILKADGALPVTAAILATNQERVLNLLDQVHSLHITGEGPTLDEFLAGFGLQWNNVLTWYGPNALVWKPFGGTQPIWELLEDLRVSANSRLEAAYRFKWDYVDLSSEDGLAKIESLQKLASVVIVDSVSLYDTVTAYAFRRLKAYLYQEQSIIVSLAPVGQTGSDWMGEALRHWTVPMLDDYFQPSIPPHSGFAKCALGVQRIKDLERLVRTRIGYLQLAAKEAEAKTIRGT